MTILRHHQTYALTLPELKQAHDAYEHMLDEHELMKAIQDRAENLILDQAEGMEKLFAACENECRIRHANSMLNYDEILKSKAIALGMWTH